MQTPLLKLPTLVIFANNGVTACDGKRDGAQKGETPASRE